MWGRRLGVRKLNARAPPVLIGYEKETFFWHKYSPDADGDGEDKQPWGFIPFFLFLSIIPHRKSFFFWCDWGSRRPYILLFSSFSRGAVVTYPTLPRHFESQKKAGWSLDNHLVAFFSSSFSPFLSCQIFPIFYIFWGEWWRLGVPRTQKKKLCIEYIPRKAHISYFFCVYILVILVF